MEVLDTSIANVALPYIAGNLGASNDPEHLGPDLDLVSNAIILPISGWLATTLGRKRFFMTSLAVLTLSSLLCGSLAPSLGLLLFFRVLQGAGGGGLQPMAQAILTPFRNSEAWRLPSLALPRSWHPRSGQPWADGSPSTIPGGRIFSSIFRLAC